MHSRIIHKTLYTYSKPVFLESNEIRLHPRSEIAQKVINYNIKIMPEPFCQSSFIDSEGNTVIKTWFQEKTDYFAVDVNFEVETLRENPYDFIVDFDRAKLPVNYDESTKNDLKMYLEIKKESLPVKNFSDAIKKEAGYDILLFLSTLAEKIRKTCDYEIREEGHPHTAEHTLQHKKGSCRDLSILFIECCKYQGVASRFVSGYLIEEEQEEQLHMHAWSEAYIPGAGWRGYDPTNGIASAQRHIPVAASYNPEKAAPVRGNFRSNTAECKLEFELNIEEL